MRFWDEISTRLAGLSGSATPEEARQALNEFDTRDIQAVRVSEGGGGGSSPLSVLGPFTINWDDAGVNSNKIDVADIAAGTSVIRCWAIVTEAWLTTNEDPFQFSLEIGDAADSASAVLVDYPSTDGTLQPFNENLGTPDTAFRSRVGLVPASGWKLRASVWVNGAGTLQTGSVDFYALVAA